ncbi:hypothetical protein AVEN_245818-1 [Araneus ventricosus]|uniref:Uncharacterized protein n=1 Tax=Araneus ventricosus TaxID=182803 RepID=A0A4Y2EAT8_ARAVE|nr:hypothetical protein AVEN_245818-1 [Araneus ventricosus]
MDKWLKTGILKRSISRTEIRTTDLAAMEITVDQQDDNHEVQRPTDWPVQIFDIAEAGSRVQDPISLGIRRVIYTWYLLYGHRRQGRPRGCELCDPTRSLADDGFCKIH